MTFGSKMLVRLISGVTSIVGVVMTILTGQTTTSAQLRNYLPPIGIKEVSRLDLLPRLKDSVIVESISSYDRTGGNDDGFSGKYSFVRKEGDALVIADLKGPGCIYRIWTPTPTDDLIEFYFDGEAKPRISLPYRELFLGRHRPFNEPLVGFGSGGFYCYLPIPYKVSCKVVIHAALVQFYQINHATYRPGTQLETFNPDSPDMTGEAMTHAVNLLGLTGKDLSYQVSPSGSKLHTVRAQKTVAPGQSVTLFETHLGGRIAGLRLSSATALAGKARDLLLKITWDGAKNPAVLCPVGDFFGAAWGTPAMRSLLVGTDSDTDYVYFPMPFDSSARIELVSDAAPGSALPEISVMAEVIVSDALRKKDEGRFYAVWNRENPTTEGTPFNYINIDGRGHLVGVTLQAQGSIPGITPFFEGDDQAWLDGELTIHGTGSEDFFNGGWYDVPGRWEERASYPLSGCLEYSRPQARSGGYRLFLTDAYAFHKSLKLDMEHAPEHNTFVADYVGVSYLYLENPPVKPWHIPAQPARAVTDPTRLVFSPGWYMPLHAFSMQNATLTKRVEHMDREHRYLTLETHGENMFGDHMISLLCAVPAAGKYKVSIEPMVGPNNCIVQLFQRERAMGLPVDTYADRRAWGGTMPLGELELKEGLNQVLIKLVGKNPKVAFGGLKFDIESLVLDRK